MNPNHRQLINNLIPILWHSGHMGAFFGRFLFDNLYVKHIADDFIFKNHYKTMDNTEWRWSDRTNLFFSVPRNSKANPFESAYNILKKYYVSEQELDAAITYIAVQYTSKFFENENIANYQVIPLWENTYSEEELVALTNKEFNFNFDNFPFPYIKSHIHGSIDRINALPWKKKIVCRFPREKTWLATLLLFYKHYWFRVNNNMSVDESFQQNSAMNFLKLATEETFFSDYYIVEDKIDFSSYINVDMYDLIFNNNSEQLIPIDQCFSTELSTSRKELLLSVKNDIIKVCALFGLNHEMNIYLGDDISIIKTNQVMEVVDYIKK